MPFLHAADSSCMSFPWWKSTQQAPYTNTSAQILAFAIALPWLLTLVVKNWAMICVIALAV